MSNYKLKIGNYVKVIFDNYVETIDYESETWITLDGEKRHTNETPEEIEKYRILINKVGVVTHVDTNNERTLGICVRFSNSDEYGYDERELEKITEDAYYLYKFKEI